MNEDKTVSIRICQDGHANSLALNKDCTQIVVGGRSLLKIFSIEYDGFTEVCNMRGGKSQNLSYSSNCVAWSTLDSNYIATAATNGVVSIWDLSKFGRSKQFLVYTEHERTTNAVQFHTTDPNLLISGSQDGTIKCFDIRVEKAVNTYCSNSESVRDVKFSPHAANTFASVSENGTVQLWDVRRPDKCTSQFTAHSGPIYTVDWNPVQPWLATGSRDKQIKVWNTSPKSYSSESSKNVSLEYTIHTIAVVGRVKWRPDKLYHIASCALVVDYSIYIWDVRRPYIPYASFNEHTNVTTDIAFRDSHILLSTSKDSTIFKHVFRDATRPAQKANPQGASFNYKGDILYAFKTKHVEPPPPTSSKNNLLGYVADLIEDVEKIKMRSNRKTPPTLPGSTEFHFSKSMLVYFRTKPQPQNMKDVTKTSLLKDYQAFKGCAQEYILKGPNLFEICDHNSNVAKKYGKTNISFLWNLVKQLYSSLAVPNKLEQRHSNTSQNLVNRLMAQNSNQSDERNGSSGVINSANDEDFTNKVFEFKTPGPNINGQPMNDNESTNCDFIFGDSEFIFDNVNSVKNFRNGFLYIGPHELIKEYSFPNDSIMTNTQQDLHSRRLRKELSRSSQESASPPNNPMSFLKIIENVQPPLWEPHKVMADCLLLQSEIGEVQSASCILLVLGERRSNLLFNEDIQETWTLNYIELLHRHQLWNQATEVINLSWNRRVLELNQQSTTMHTNCGECGKPILNTGWYCLKCKSSASSKCVVCNQVVRGLFAWCQGCSHGGHISHLKHWFSNNSKCPKCGHECEYD